VQGEAGHDYRLTGHADDQPEIPAWNVFYRGSGEPGDYLALDRPPAGATVLRYTLEARTPAGAWFPLGETMVGIVTAVTVPDLQLTRVYPNPFNPRVNIDFTLAADAPVTMEVYDIRGQRVRRLVDRTFPAGAHAVTWDGRDDAGRGLSTGTYLLQISGPAARRVEKLVLVK
jgi:hypothetical protein